jgi:hypothetical protein
VCHELAGDESAGAISRATFLNGWVAPTRRAECTGAPGVVLAPEEPSDHHLACEGGGGVESAEVVERRSDLALGGPT